MIPVVLSYAAVDIPNWYLAEVPTPTTLLIEPAANKLLLSTISNLVFAPTIGAYPRPGVDPIETIRPPLGNWFWLMSNSDCINSPLAELIPVNTTLVIPALASAENS